MARPSRLSKKLPPHSRGASRRHSAPQTRRDLVPRRGAHRPEERPRSPVGAARNTADAARRSALRARVSVWRHLPCADTDAMQLHLEEISRTVARRSHAVLLLDRAGWHTTGNLSVPKNITLIFLPSRAPELNPVEQIWQYIRANWLSNRVFDTYDDIIDAACDAWKRLIAEPNAITSIGMPQWARNGQS